MRTGGRLVVVVGVVALTGVAAALTFRAEQQRQEVLLLQAACLESARAGGDVEEVCAALSLADDAFREVFESTLLDGARDRGREVVRCWDRVRDYCSDRPAGRYFRECLHSRSLRECGEQAPDDRTAPVGPGL